MEQKSIYFILTYLCTKQMLLRYLIYLCSKNFRLNIKIIYSFIINNIQILSPLFIVDVIVCSAVVTLSVKYYIILTIN